MRAVIKGIGLAAGLAVVVASGRARACDEVSDVTGYRRCSSFGYGWDESPLGRARTSRWWRPVKPLPLFLEAAAVAQTVDAGSVTFRDTTADSRSFSLHNPALGTTIVYGLDLRAGFRVAGPFFAGIATRFAFGGLPQGNTAVVDGLVSGPSATDGARVDLGNVLGVVSIGELAGFAMPLSSRIRLRLEVTAGLEDVGLLAIKGIACAQNPCGPDSPRGFIEPHVVADLWLGPHWSLGLFAGDDVLHASSGSLGLMTSWHWQGFDGRP
jgi:hypothetical protein